MHSKNDNIEIIISDKAAEVIYKQTAGIIWKCKYTPYLSEKVWR